MLEGCSNLQKHVENMKKFNIPFVIGINKFGAITFR
jgi:formyltetrahydrofolate synthetase